MPIFLFRSKNRHSLKICSLMENINKFVQSEFSYWIFEKKYFWNQLLYFTTIIELSMRFIRNKGDNTCTVGWGLFYNTASFEVQLAYNMRNWPRRLSNTQQQQLITKCSAYFLLVRIPFSLKNNPYMQRERATRIKWDTVSCTYDHRTR